MDALLIAVAFLFGLIAQQMRLPPLVGFLVAGFVLHAMGKTGGDALKMLADLGVTLMLFSIGLKLRVGSLLRPEIWAGTTIHSALTVSGISLLLLGLGAAGLPLLGGQGAAVVVLVAFALSFSSTVFAVKSLEENGERGALHGRIAIGILIMQDLIAVVFLTLSSGKVPSAWAIVLLAAFFLLRPALNVMISRCGHGELITLCGLFLALVLGAKGFEAVGLKADLGALFVGILFGQHPKAKELGKSLATITDLFLVGFFLNIGLTGLPDLKGLVLAVFLTLLVPLKSALFVAILTRFDLRARTAWMSGLALGSYSEFGLIVMAVGVSRGWLGPEWLVIAAIALSLSFIGAAPLNRHGEALYIRLAGLLRKLETKRRHPDDIVIPDHGEQVGIFGMGRVGQSAYRALEQKYGRRVIAFDRDPAAVEKHRALGRNVVLADATDSDFWNQVRARKSPLELVVLAMPKHSVNVHAAATLQQIGFDGVVAATAKFDDEVRELRGLGVDTAFNLYAEAGSGFAQQVSRVFRQQRPDLDARFRHPGEGRG